jgi:hypothetical protein
MGAILLVFNWLDSCGVDLMRLPVVNVFESMQHR